MKYFNIIYLKKKLIKQIKPKRKRIKVCICTLGKKENKYIREYVNHYEKYGVDKINLYDNNDLNGENFEDAISDYINKGLVDIFNWRGKTNCYKKIMNDCYIRNFKKYNWLMFFELDEFIHLQNYSSVKDFLNEKKFDKCNLIFLNSIFHTDNDLLYYENKSLFERFPNRIRINKKTNLEVKYILRGNIPSIKIEFIHVCCNIKQKCNALGHFNSTIGIFAKEPDTENYYYDHFYSKSTEEFINKLTRGDSWNMESTYMMHKIKKYFSQSRITKKKILMIEKATKYNLTKFKKLNFNDFYDKL